MLPTLNVFDDWILVNSLYRRGRWVKVGDLVSFRHPLVPGARASKRVIGMSGDFVMTGSKEGGEGEGMMIQVCVFCYSSWMGDETVSWDL